jgi:hypothetical protein
MFAKSWVLLAVLIAGGLLAACGGDGDKGSQTPFTGLEGTPQPAPIIRDGGGMAIDAVSGGAVDASRVVTGSDPFDVDLVVDKAVSGYQGYQFTIQWDPTVLAYQEQKDLQPEQMVLCATPNVKENSVYSGCARVSENTSYVGPLNTLTFQCVADGVSPMHLVSLTEDPAFGTSELGFSGVTVETTLTDASVTCQGLGQAPAAAPTAMP